MLLIAIANGGKAPSANGDDGNLNQDPGLVSNMVKTTGEVTLRWRNFGAYARGFAFYDFEQEVHDGARTKLSGKAPDFVGKDADLLDYYLSARVHLGGVPLQLRLGDQVVNWGQSSFLRFGVDTINPVDLVALTQPVSTARDLPIPQGMLWGAASVTENVAVEGLYQHEWRPVRPPPVGWFFSTSDLIGAEGLNYAMAGFGRFSDLGTNLDAVFGFEMGVTQLLGPRLRSSQTVFGFDIGWVHIHNLPGSHPFDEDSWGYRLIGLSTYDSVLGGVTLQPRVVWTHDIAGLTPGPGGAFLAGRQAFSLGLGGEYVNRWTADLSYTTFFAGGSFNEEAARLEADLTPLGAERDGNAAGTIPSWTGGMTEPPPGYEPGDHHPDPYPADAIFFTITAANATEHATHLSEGQKALLAAHPDTWRAMSFIACGWSKEPSSRHSGISMRAAPSMWMKTVGRLWWRRATTTTGSSGAWPKPIW